MVLVVTSCLHHLPSHHHLNHCLLICGWYVVFNVINTIQSTSNSRFNETIYDNDKLEILSNVLGAILTGHLAPTSLNPRLISCNSTVSISSCPSSCCITCSAYHRSNSCYPHPHGWRVKVLSLCVVCYHKIAVKFKI